MLPELCKTYVGILYFVPDLQSKKSVQLCLQYKSFENTVGKGEIARNEQFLLFPQCFLTIWKTFCQNSSNLKSLSANSFSFEGSEIRRLGKG